MIENHTPLISCPTTLTVGDFDQFEHFFLLDCTQPAVCLLSKIFTLSKTMFLVFNPPKKTGQEKQSVSLNDKAD